MKFGNFESVGKLGKGMMGDVWEVRHAWRPGRFAAKILSGPLARQESFILRFEREVRAMARLRHPNVLRIFDYGRLEGADLESGIAPGSPYYVLEYAQGGELDRKKVDSWETLEAVLSGVLRGLAHSHARRVLHRDIKPANILFVERRGVLVPALADYGIAHALERQRPTAGDDFTARNAEEATGTPLYMAPEQFMGTWRDYGPPTDLYAVGIMAYVLVSGRSPFAGENLFMMAEKHLNDPMPDIEPKYDVPDHLNAWVQSLTAKSPADRPQRAMDALVKLGRNRSLISLPRDWRGFEPDDQPGKSPVGLGLHGLQRLFLVGRMPERDALWEALRDVQTGHKPEALVLCGAPGVGRSRLVEWLANTAVEHDLVARVFRARFESDEAGSTIGLPWMLVEYFRCAGMKYEDVEARVQKVLPTWTTDEVRAMTQVLSQAESIADERVPPTVKPTMVWEMCRRLLAHEAQDRPVILILDDIDRDPTGSVMGFLHGLLMQTGTGPVLVVATSELPPERFDSLTLASLGPQEFRRLLRDEMGLPLKVSDRVETIAAGNPQFAVDLVGFWLERDELKNVDGQLELDPEPTIPETLTDVWIERVERVSRELNPVVVRAGAALGTEIDLREWLAVAKQLDPAVEADVVSRTANQWVNAGLAQWGVGERLTLVHPTVVHAVERLSKKSEWSAAHGAAARALTGLYPHDYQGLARRVAHHFLDSGSAVVAYMALQPALESALESVDANEIVRVADALLEALAAQKATDDDPRVALARALRAITWLTSSREDDRERAARWLDRAAQVAEHAKPADAARIRTIVAWASNHRGGRDEAAAEMERIVANHALPERIRLFASVIAANLNTYRHDAEAVRRHAQTVFSADCPPAWHLRALEALLHVALSERDVESALRWKQNALHVVEELGRLHLEIHLENLAGFICDLSEDFRGAELHHANAERLVEIVIPQSGVRLMSREYRARAMVRQQKWGEAYPLLSGLADEVESGRAPSLHPWDSLLACAIALDKKADETRARARCFEAGDRSNALNVAAIRAVLDQLVARGRFDEVDQLRAEALSVFERAPSVTPSDLATL